MVNELFSWKEWERSGPYGIVYFDVVFKKDFYKFHKGEEFYSCDFDFEGGYLYFYKKENENCPICVEVSLIERNKIN